jgi:small subunit ribosomal protein S16
MLKIRLQRVGRKNDPSFRLIVVDSHRAAKTGSVIEVVGNYDARSRSHSAEAPRDKARVKVDRVKYWISVGAQVSGTVHNLLIDQKVISGKKINVLPKKTPIKKPEEVKPEEVKPEAAPAEKAKEEAAAEPAA